MTTIIGQRIDIISIFIIVVITIPFRCIHGTTNIRKAQQCIATATTTATTAATTSTTIFITRAQGRLRTHFHCQFIGISTIGCTCIHGIHYIVWVDCGIIGWFLGYSRCICGMFRLTLGCGNTTHGWHTARMHTG
jgi:hypothetical protein